MQKQLKVALVHDQLNQAGGAERVLYALKEIFPNAPIYTILHDTNRLKGFEKFDVRTSFIQNMPLSKRLFKWYLPLMPTAVEHLDLSAFDLVISSTSALIKGVITGPNTPHICYCHTPTRYLWSDASEYSKKLDTPSFIKKMLPFYLSKLRAWDQIASQRVDHYIANSEFVKKRIRNYYKRDAEVIHPPVDTSNYKPSHELGNYFLMLGRLRPYKKFDLAIHAFNKLQIPLKILGTGDQAAELKKMARPNIEFLGAVDESKKRELMSKCLAFINPQVEDFGITTVEAMASGRPVIAYREGGAEEIIIEGITGEFINDQTWAALIDKILHFDAQKYDSNQINLHAQQYSTEIFKKRIVEFVNSVVINNNKHEITNILVPKKVTSAQ